MSTTPEHVRLMATSAAESFMKSMRSFIAATSQWSVFTLQLRLALWSAFWRGLLRHGYHSERVRANAQAMYRWVGGEGEASVRTAMRTLLDKAAAMRAQDHGDAEGEGEGEGETEAAWGCWKADVEVMLNTEALAPQDEFLDWVRRRSTVRPVARQEKDQPEPEDGAEASRGQGRKRQQPRRFESDSDGDYHDPARRRTAGAPAGSDSGAGERAVTRRMAQAAAHAYDGNHDPSITGPSSPVAGAE